MTVLHMVDAGDGLSMHLHTDRGPSLIIDCGTQSRSDAVWQSLLLQSYQGDCSFLLSHVHADHYNGLVWLAHNNPKKNLDLGIRHAYFPRLPAVPAAREFFTALTAVNLYILGRQTGVADYDFLRAIRSLTSHSVTAVPLSAGDTFDIAGTTFTVLWPPADLTEQSLRPRVNRALGKFYRAVEAVPDLHEMVQTLRNKVDFDVLSSAEATVHESLESATTSPRFNCFPPLKPLPPELRQANDALRKVANDLSLAFYDSSLCFLGDLRSAELPEIVKRLQAAGRIRFPVGIAPHHGTHWHKDLRKLHFTYVLSSFGPRLARYWKREFLDITEHSLATRTSGHLYLRTEVRASTLGQ